MNDTTSQPARTDDVGRPFSELRNTGLLWLINRVVFHPRGYALALHFVRPDGECTGWTLLGDGTEVYSMGELDEDRLYGLVKELLK